MNFEKYAEAGRRDAFLLAKLAKTFGEMFGPEGGLSEQETRSAYDTIRKNFGPSKRPPPSRPAALLARRGVTPPPVPAKALAGLH